MKLREMFKGKKGIIFAVPGAFTPGCSKVRRRHKPELVLSAGGGTLLTTPLALLRSRATSPATSRTLRSSRARASR